MRTFLLAVSTALTVALGAGAATAQGTTEFRADNDFKVKLSLDAKAMVPLGKLGLGSNAKLAGKVGKGFKLGAYIIPPENNPTTDGEFGDVDFSFGINVGGGWGPFEELESGGGAFVSPVGGEDHFYSAGLGAGAEIALTDGFYAKTSVEAGAAFRSAKVTSTSAGITSTLYEGDGIVPYFGVSAGIFYDYCSCFDIGVTASFYQLGAIDVSQPSFPANPAIELGESRTFAVGLSLRRSF